MGDGVLSRLGLCVQRLSVRYYRERIWALSIDAAAAFVSYIDRSLPARYSASQKMAYEPLAPLGIGLIGLGRHGSRYARHLIADLPKPAWWL